MRAPGLTLDLYHVDSAYVAWRSGLDADATFDLYARAHPFGGGYLLAAGLEPAIGFARSFGYTDDDIAWLASQKAYDPGFLAVLRGTTFTGAIDAMAEGTVVFAGEPLLRVTGPLREALLLESGLLHDVNLSTLIATKAARVVAAARDKPVAEFGLRRAHEPYLAVRSSWIGGVASTSFLDAARRFGIPSTGTIPHALVQAYPTEQDAFRAVAEALPEYTLLLDTYDVETAIHTAAAVARDAAQRLGHRLTAVRLDSGDLAAQARLCRRVLDEAGLTEVRIIASGDLDEFRIGELLADDPPIDAFGVGTAMAVGAGSAARGIDGGSLASVYKLVWYGDDRAAIKRAGEKSTWPGRKQVWRVGSFERDVIALDDEPAPADAVPLLEPVLKDGDLVGALPDHHAARERARAQLDALPPAIARSERPEAYPVIRSEQLRALREAALAEHGLA